MLIKKERIPILQIVTIGFLPSSLKKLIYRIKGYSIGKKVAIGLGSVVVGKKVSIGNNTKIGFLSVVRAKEIQIERFVRIGSMVFIDTEKILIDDDSIIGEMVGIGGIRTKQSLLKIGKRCHVFSYSLINPTLPVILGDDSSFGYANYVFTHASWNSVLDGFPVIFAPITIGKGVWLPSRVQIFPNVNIGDGAVIGAGSIVTKNIPANSLAVGSPAKLIKEGYPPKLSREKRDRIIDNIFNDFANHLIHHSFNIETIKKEDYSSIKVSDGDSNYILFYINSLAGLNELTIEDSELIIIDNENLDILKNEVIAKMIIDYQNKQRKGTSVIGEEFVSFISRYGIRFNRLD